MVTDPLEDAMLQVDPVTGARTSLSDASIGSGPALTDPQDSAVEAAGTLVIVDAGLQAVIRVDPGTGNRMIMSDAIVGSGPALLNPQGILVDTTGALVVTDSHLDAMVRIDAITGDRTILSGCPEPLDPCPVPLVGMGPVFSSPQGIGLEATGTFVVVDQGLGAVIRVDPAAGDRTMVSDASTGSRPVLTRPEAIGVVAVTGMLVVVDTSLDAVVQIDPTTGDRVIVSGCADVSDPCPTPLVGSGPAFINPKDIAVEAAGTVVVVDASLEAAVRIDLLTGDRTVVSGCPEGPDLCPVSPIGNGSAFSSPEVIAVDAAGMLVVIDALLGTVMRVDPVTGDRTIVASGMGS